MPLEVNLSLKHWRERNYEKDKLKLVGSFHTEFRCENLSSKKSTPGGSVRLIRREKKRDPICDTPEKEPAERQATGPY